ALLHAAMAGDEEGVACLIAKGCLLHVTDEHGNTPLHLAANFGHFDVMATLLSTRGGRDQLAARNVRGEEPLHMAARWDHPRALRFLLESGANALAKDGKGRTPLDVSISQDIAEMLRAATPPTLTATPTAPSHETQSNSSHTILPLSSSAGLSHHLLTSARSEPSHMHDSERSDSAVRQAARRVDSIGADEAELTPLHSAALNDDVKQIAALLAQQDSSKHHAPVHATSSVGNSPLHLAAKKGHTRAIDMLLAAGADVTARNGCGWSPLHYAVRYGHAHAAEALIRCGANVYAPDALGTAPHELASSPEMASVLRGKAGWQQKDAALLDAAEQGDAQEVLRLLQANAFVDASSPAGDTALHRAARFGDVEAVKPLTSRRAQIDAQDKLGRPALDLASKAEVRAALKAGIKSRATVAERVLAMRPFYGRINVNV
ncbi:MAG: hypothetical protein SGPRY_013970, partial [Prymnesium sp.]